jgi:hypothetical protein
MMREMQVTLPDSPPVWGGRDRPFLLALLLFWVLWFFCFRPYMVNPDGVAYYAYGRSLLFDLDFSFRNEFQTFDIWRYFYDITPLGHMKNVFAMGSSVLWLPFLALAHLVVLAANALGAGLEAEGYGGLYSTFICFGTSLYGFFTLVLCYRLACRFVARGTALWATVAIWTLSSFWHYVYFGGSFSHVPAAFAVTLFLYGLVRARETGLPSVWFLAGAAGGLAALVRWQNLALPALVAGALAWGWVRPFARGIRGGTTAGPHERRFALTRLLLFGAGALLALLPQLFVWRVLFGSWVTIPHGAGFFHWKDPFLFKALLSSHHGLYAWTPILFLATVPGLLLFLRRDRALGLFMIAAFLVQVYVNSVVYDVEAGVSYGARRFVAYTPFYVLGLAAFLQAVPRTLGVLLTGVAAVWNGLLWLAFQFGLIDPQLYVSFGQILRSQARALERLPELVGRLFATTAIGRVEGSPTLQIAVLLVMFGIAFLSVRAALRIDRRPAASLAHLRWTALAVAGVLGAFANVCALAATRTRPAPVEATWEGKAAMLDFAWYANSKYDLDPFQPNWYYTERNHFPDLRADTLTWHGVPFVILPSRRLPRDPGSVITTCYQDGATFTIPLEPRPTRAFHFALDAGLCYGERIPVARLRVVYDRGEPWETELWSGVDVWDYMLGPPTERRVWSGGDDQQLTGYALEADSARNAVEIVIEGIPKMEDRRNNPGVVVFAVTREGVSGGEERFDPVDLEPFVNSDYHGDPFKPGIVENHFPDLEPGVVRYRGVPFRILDAEDPPKRGTVITTAYVRTHRVRVPLVEQRSERIALLLDGGLMRGFHLHASDLVVEYAGGPPDRFEIWSGTDVRDYWEDGPEGRVAWEAEKPQDLTYHEIGLDPGRVPMFLWIEGVPNQGVLGMNAGIAVFAITQVVE